MRWCSTWLNCEVDTLFARGKPVVDEGGDDGRV